jgi:urease accessory protein
MLNLREVVPENDDMPEVGGTLTLTFEERRRSRLLVQLDDQREAALLLPRGTVLLDGQHLRVEGQPWLVLVRAAAETLSVARAQDPHLIARAAYHLGNRHVALEIGPGWVAYAHDHVLDGLVRSLGLDVGTRIAPFEPESGGYKHEGARAEGTRHGNGHAHGPHHHHTHDT